MNGKIWIVLVAILFTGCQAKELAPTGTPEALFIPPASGEDHEQNSEVPPPAPPTQQGNCVNQLRYLKDLTIPDGTEVLEGEKITKRWLITNEGSCNWDRQKNISCSTLPGRARKQFWKFPSLLRIIPGDTIPGGRLLIPVESGLEIRFTWISQ